MSKKIKKVMVVGAGKLQSKTIQLVKEMGHYCIVVDGNQNAEGFKIADDYRVIDVLDLEACLIYAKEANIDGVLTTSATITLPAVSYVAKNLGLRAIDYESVDNLRDKFMIKEKLDNMGQNSRGSLMEFTSKTPLELLKENKNYPLVFKPNDGSGSKGVVVVESFEEVNNAAKLALEGSRVGKAYIEPFIDGEEFGVESFVFEGDIVVFGVIKQIFKQNSNGVIEYGHCMPAPISKKIEEKIIREVKKAIQNLGINYGSVNMDIILSKENIPYIIDVGARIGLNQIAEKIIPYSTGINILESTIKASLRENVSFVPKYSKPVASRVLIFNPGKVQKIGDYKSLIDGKNVLDIIFNLKPGDEINEYKVKGDASGWVITTGKTVEEAEKIANITRNKIANLIKYK